MEWLQQLQVLLMEVRVAVMTYLFIVVATALTADPQEALRECAYRSTRDPYPIKVTYTEIRDTERDKAIPLKVYYPQARGVFPVILFSHGAGGSRETATDLARQWAATGYVCIHPSHIPTIDPDLGFSVGRFVKEVADLYAMGPPFWDNRIRDLTFLMDHLGEIETKTPALSEKIDSTRIGVGGHSLGAYTAMLIGGMRVNDPVTGQEYNFSDPRVRAVLALSGPGSWDRRGTTNRSWEKVTIPMMVVAGSADPGLEGEAPAWRGEAFYYAPPGDKYLVFIDGATHISYVGLNEGANEVIPIESLPPGLTTANQLQRLLTPALAQDAVLEYTIISSSAFWDAHLKDNLAGDTYLETDLIEWYSLGKTSLDRN